MKSILKANLDRKISLSPAEFELFFKSFELFSYRKKEHLLQAGNRCEYYFFVVKGLVRNYHIDQKGKEHITAFAIENWWVTDLDSFFKKEQAELHIQALEETTVLAITIDKLEAAFISIPLLNTFFRIQMQNMLMAIQRRHHFYMKEEGKKRYEFLVKRLPEFVQRIPQYMLASYLDLTPEYLSELRKIPFNSGS